MPRSLSTPSRRQFLGTALGAGVAALTLGPQRLLAAAAEPARPVSLPSRPGYFGVGAPTHLAWVWQFRQDGTREEIRDVLAAHGLGIVLKTHDGADWMSRYDKTPDAITGPRRIEELANYFENGGVPFHCWCVVHGESPAREAEMAAEVLDAGARSLSLDVESYQGFWSGTNADAERYGEALRWRAPRAALVTSVDPRPWELDRIPLKEFASFTDGLAPQVYWYTFSSPLNVKRYRDSGNDPGPAGITARWALDVTMNSLAKFNLPITPVGDGSTPNMGAWRDFIDASYEYDLEAVSVWRYGIAPHDLWGVLRDSPPKVSTYTVEPGDTISGIARAHGTDVASLLDANDLSNPNLIRIGQQLRLPRGARSGGSPTVTPGQASAAVPPAAAQTHEIGPGDTLWSLSRAWGTTPDAIARVNGIADPSRIRIGQRLRIP